MIIRLFKDSNPLSYLISLVGLVAIFGFFGQGVAVSEPDGNGLLFDFLISGLAVLPKWATGMMVLLFVGTQAYHWNLVITNHEVIYKKSLLPMLFVIVFASMRSDFLTMHPVLPVISISIFILDKLFSVYKNAKPTGIIFDCGFLSGIACLFWFESLMLFPFVLFALFILKPLSLRDVLLLILGLATPLFLAFVYLLMMDVSPLIPSLLPFQHLDFYVDGTVLIQQNNRPFLIVFILTMALSIWRINRNFYKNATRVRVYQQTIFLLMICTLLGFVISRDEANHVFYFMALPFSSMVAYYFVAGKSVWWEEFLFMAMMFATIMFH